MTPKLPGEAVSGGGSPMWEKEGRARAVPKLSLQLAVYFFLVTLLSGSGFIQLANGVTLAVLLFLRVQLWV